MIKKIREAYNSRFTEEKYNAFVKELNSLHPGAIDFRLAETPVFVPKELEGKMLDACESIIDFIVDPSFKELTERAIPSLFNVPGENDHAHFIVFDFGVSEDASGNIEPQLIEMQGFPSLFGFEVFRGEMFRKHFTIPENLTPYLNGYNKESYLRLLKEIIVDGQDPTQVVLLELFPHRQKTRIDFYCTQDYTGINIVCLTELIKEGNKLYYLNKGVKTVIHRIYNRIIFDELLQQPSDVQQKARILFEEIDVHWVPHPSWFYRISKFTMPFIRDPYIPATFFLNEIKQLPDDVENYVLKPLFSFAGQGVKIDITLDDINKIADPENWILQRKVKYADIIQTPDGPAKVEIRLFYFWKDGAHRPVAVHNLARLSKGKMIGVDYNKGKTWVGGTLCFFEQ